MRTAFINTLCELAENDDRIWLLTGDLGFSVLEQFADRWPARYVNTGIAEQNMASVAAGLASCGHIVFVYSIANFPTFRCLEQLRNDIVYHGLDVKIVSVGAGFAYGTAGYTHHGIEDLAVMRSLPGMTVVAPADPIEAAWATQAITAQPGPAYLRLGKSREPVLHTTMPDFEIGKAITMRDGSDVTLISTGSMLQRALDAAACLLREHGIHARVLSMPTVKPIDSSAVQCAAQETRGIVVMEEHRVVGGLGSAVAEVLAAMTPPHAPLRMFGIPDEPVHQVGSQAYMIESLGNVVETVTELLTPSKRVPPPIAVPDTVPATATNLPRS